MMMAKVIEMDNIAQVWLGWLFWLGQLGSLWSMGGEIVGQSISMNPITKVFAKVNQQTNHQDLHQEAAFTSIYYVHASRGNSLP